MDPVTLPRRRPFGVIIVALLQLGTVTIALGSYLTGVTLPWEGSVAQVVADNGWARIAIVVFAILIGLATIGMWNLRRWGWALMISLVGISLVLDITTWARQGDQDRHLALYLRMALDVVSAFYLNSASVQAVFHRGTDDTHLAISTSSAGRVDP